MDEKSESKRKILQTARSLFAEKGFDGSRVDEIARRAGVNKALIYYYFRNKQALLDELISKLKSEYSAQRESALRHTSADSPEFVDTILRKNLDFMLQNRDLITIVLMEDLKNSDESILIGMWEEVYRNEKAALSADSEVPETGGITREMIALYFYNFMPLISYLALGRQFAGRFGIDENELQEVYQGITRALMGKVMDAGKDG